MSWTMSSYQPPVHMFYGECLCVLCVSWLVVCRLQLQEHTVLFCHIFFSFVKFSEKQINISFFLSLNSITHKVVYMLLC